MGKKNVMTTVGSQLSELVGTEVWSDNRNVQIIEVHVLIINVL